MPQERVHAFAQLNPNERLVETMLTVGGRLMVEQYDQLKSFKSTEHEVVNNISELTESIEQLKRQNSGIEADVKRFMQREQIMEKIILYEKRIPWALYEIARTRFLELKALRDQAKVRYIQYRDRPDPLSNQINQLTASIIELKTQKDSFTKEQGEVNKVLNQIEEHIADSETRIDSCRSEIIRHRKAEHERLRKLKTCEEQFASNQKEIEKGVPDIPQHLDQSIDKILIRLRQLTEQKEDVGIKVEEGERNMASLKEEGMRIQGRLKRMADVRLQRLGRLQHMSPDIFHAYEWVQDHKSMFLHPVELTFLGINIRKPEYTDSVTALINRNVLNSFVVKCREDYQTLMHNCADQNRWRINVIQLESPNHSSADYRSPIEREELRKIGFECWAIDQISAPDSVLTALCEHSNMHRIPISKRPVDDQRAQSAGLLNYVAGGMRCIWKISKYGSRLASMRASKVRQNRMFEDHVDEEEKSSLESNLKHIKRNYGEIEEMVKSVKSDIAKLDEQIDLIKLEKEQYVDEKKKYQISIRALKSLEFKQERLQIDINRLKSESGEGKTRELLDKLANECLARAEKAVEYQKLCMKLDMTKRSKLLFSLIDAQKKKQSLELERTSRFDELKREEELYERARKAAEEAKSEATDLLEKAKRKASVEEAKSGIFDRIPAELEQVEELLAAEQAKLDLTIGTDPHIIDMYNSRKRQIIEKKREFQTVDAQLVKLRAEIHVIKEAWETRLLTLIDSLSDKFAVYFGKLGCAGQIQLNKLSTNPSGREDDYSNWGIEILVKFRDNEELAPLNPHRQSGGERSVSIVMFLMALQTESTSPFRVVDEINQGMDPRNERLVHRQIVETICGPTDDESAIRQIQSQYFLITPKLLPDLIYHENMRVLTIYNGEWLPDIGEWGASRAETWTTTDDADQE